MSLVRLATNNPSDIEARTAATQVCDLLKRHPDLLSEPEDAATIDPDDPFWVPAQKPEGSKSEIHPRTAAYRAWAAFLRKHKISEGSAPGEGLCLCCGKVYDLCCGKVYDADEAVFRHPKLGATHRRCASWWRSFDFSGVESAATSFADDEEIPF
jgi:hypothetical protein